MSSGGSFSSWGEGASLALVDHAYRDGATKKMPYGVNVFTTISIAPHLFLLRWLKLNLVLLLDQLKLV